MKAPKLRWKKIGITVTEMDQIIGIDFKLPNNIKSVKGIHATVKGLLSTEKEVISHLGELSLSFNSRQHHPVHMMVDYDKNEQNKKSSLMLDTKIKANQTLSGYYIDYGKVKDSENRFWPYTINIYLECEIH